MRVKPRSCPKRCNPQKQTTHENISIFSIIIFAIYNKWELWVCGGYGRVKGRGSLRGCVERGEILINGEQWKSVGQWATANY